MSDSLIACYCNMILLMDKLWTATYGQRGKNKHEKTERRRAVTWLAALFRGVDPQAFHVLFFFFSANDSE